MRHGVVMQREEEICRFRDSEYVGYMTGGSTYFLNKKFIEVGTVYRTNKRIKWFLYRITT